MAINKRLNNICIPYKSEHVRGHQDGHKTDRKQKREGRDNTIRGTKQHQYMLTWEARLSVVADDLTMAAYGRLKLKHKRMVFYEYPEAQ
eukprot:14750799-Ditylum_brightwellii.AAC.1